MKKVAISIGDLNGVGIELALKSHDTISNIVDPIYCIDDQMLKQASQILNLKVPPNFKTIDNFANSFTIEPGVVSENSGKYSFESFMSAVSMARDSVVDAVCTMPIHKKAWELASIKYKGHTDSLRDIFKQDAIMMLGCEKLYVALFTEHIPLKDVSNTITTPKLIKFLNDFYKTHKPKSQVAVLGLNPHSGDNGVLGNEEQYIVEAIQNVNNSIGTEVFIGPIVPDIAFTPNFRKNFNTMIAMYHDQGLSPLKALYFDESINVSLNLPIIRTSVDHGTAFDIAYKKKNLNTLSYINAIKYIVNQEKN